MNTKPIPAILALLAGFVICIMSFIQHVDTVVFAKRFVIVCIIFFVIGTVVKIVIDMNFQEMAVDEIVKSLEEEGEEEPENVEAAEENED